MTKGKKRALLFVVTALLLVISTLVAISIGSVKVPVDEIIKGLISGDRSGSMGIIWDIRMPRVFIAICAGSALAVSGVLLQAVMRNPLADPGITGISSGASVVAMLVMLYIPEAVGMLPLFGFIGGMLACLAVYALAWKGGISAIRIVLAGVAVNSMLGGISGMMSILNSENLSSVLMWLNGNLGSKSWNDVRLLAIYVVIGLILAYPLSKSCNVLALGDKAAKSLGMNVNKERLIISAVGVFLAGVTTSIVGVIGFVGLVVPHISRMLIGSDHKYLIPYAALMGAVVVLVADTFGRVIASPYELPVGIVMAVLGGPFFLYLLRKGGANYAG